MRDQQKFGARTPAGFERREYTINGVSTVVHTGGTGQPVVYWHGAGNWHGFDFAERWLDRLQIIAPSHPGFGESADAPPEMHSMHDYVLHYLELFEVMGLKQVSLLGISMGGWMAAEFALAYRHLVRKLVLVAPAGLTDPDSPHTQRKWPAKRSRQAGCSRPASRTHLGSSAGCIGSRCPPSSCGRKRTASVPWDAQRNGCACCRTRNYSSWSAVVI
jgi:pimeloyl-ACP methyl ester carboxylesterase